MAINQRFRSVMAENESQNTVGKSIDGSVITKAYKYVLGETALVNS